MNIFLLLFPLSCTVCTPGRRGRGAATTCRGRRPELCGVNKESPDERSESVDAAAHCMHARTFRGMHPLTSSASASRYFSTHRFLRFVRTFYCIFQSAFFFSPNATTRSRTISQTARLLCDFGADRNFCSTFTEVCFLRRPLF